jgi:hypothetical protein
MSSGSFYGHGQHLISASKMTVTHLFEPGEEAHSERYAEPLVSRVGVTQEWTVRPDPDRLSIRDSSDAV